MKKKLTAFACALALCAVPAVAERIDDGKGPVRLISADLMSSLESWSSADASVELVALEEAPEAIIQYTDTVRSAYEGRTVSEHFAAAYPEAVGAYFDALETEQVTDEADFVAFVMSSEQDAYSKWQQEKALGENTFESFVGRNFPHLVVRAEELSVSPADRRISLVEHLYALERDDLVGEATDLLGSLTETTDPCVCWTVASFPHQPDPWQAEAGEYHNNEWGWAPKKKERFEFSLAGRGAGKDFNYYRRSNHTTYEVARNRTNYDAQMRVRMHCTENGNLGGQACEGSTCTGELAMRTAYSSRVYEKVDVGGIWSKRSQARMGDAAALLFDPPGPAPQQRLFEKGVAVAGDVKTGWNAAAGLQILQTVAQVALVIAGDGTSAASLLEGNLLDETYNAIIGLIEREGTEGSKQVDMQVAYDTAGSAPFTLLPNTTLAFDLDTVSDLYSRGYGGTSQSWGNIDSSFHMVGVARNYQCAAGVTAPTPRAFWLWSGSNNAPQSATTLGNLVANWVAAELGAWPTNASQQRAQFP